MEVTAQMVKELRSRTGAGIMDCKEALREKAGDFEEAVRYLREKGLAQAAKRAGREASEGQVSSLVAPNGRAGSLVEVNCETDFVAKTEDFQSLVDRVVRQVSEGGPESLKSDGAGAPIQEAVTAAVAKLGENILIGRAEKFALAEGEQGLVASYIHPGDRIGVLLEMKCASEGVAGGAGLAELAKDLTMQIAASSPAYLEPDAVPESFLENERSILAAQQKGSGKPENIVAKIVEGRLQKYLREICLLEQPFVKNTDQTVRAMLVERSRELGEEVEVSRFLRFQLGERGE